MIVELTRKDAEKFKPLECKINEAPAEKGIDIGYNHGKVGWNWSLVKYKGRYYVYGYRNFPKTYGKYKGE